MPLHLNTWCLDTRSSSDNTDSDSSPQAISFSKTMSTHSNPFVQGGWATSSSRPNGDQIANPPSIFGALPITTDASHSGSRQRGATLFQFTNPNPNILNSTVVSTHRDGSVHQVCFHVHLSPTVAEDSITLNSQLVRISTDEKLAGYTAFRDANQRSVALIEWVGGRPQVEVRGSVSKCFTGDWLKVVNDPNFGR